MTRALLRSTIQRAKAIADGAIAAGRDFSLAEQDQVEDLMKQAREIKARVENDEGLLKQIADLGGETYSARGDGSGRKAAGPWSEPILKASQDGFGRFKALTSGSITVPSLTRDIVRIDNRPPGLLELIPSERLEGTDTFSYLKQTVRTHNAAPVAVGTAKPTSVYTLAKVDDRVRTIAHLTEAIPRQTLSDAGLLAAFIDGELRDGVRLGLENEVVNGDASGERFDGLAHVAGTQPQAFDTDLLTTHRKAKTLLENIELMPGGYLMNPNSWETLDLLQDNEGRYFYGGPTDPPVDRVRRKLWGVDVALSTVVPDGVAYLVDWAGSTHLWEREAVEITWSENTIDIGTGKSIFELNQVKYRGEGRFGFAVMRPTGVVKIALS